MRPVYDFPSLARLGGLAALAPPMVVMPAGLSQVALGNGAMMLTNMAGGPAVAAALLGPAGLQGMLAAFSPTRVVSVLNAITDVDMANREALLDLLTDIAAEAQGAASAAAAAIPSMADGGLVRALTPLPRKGEVLEPSVGRAKGPLKHVGADGMLEDGRVGGEEGGSKSTQQPLSDALVLAVEPEARGLGQQDRRRAPTAATEMFKKLGGGFTEHITTSSEGKGAYASFTAASAEPPAAATSHDSATQEDAGASSSSAGAQGEDANAPHRTRGLGRVYLEFNTVESAVAAFCALSGRFFSGHILVASFESDVTFCSGGIVCLSQGPLLGSPDGEQGSLVLAGPALAPPAGSGTMCTGELD